MEVRNFSQGGQTNLDITLRNTNVQEGTNNTNVAGNSSNNQENNDIKDSPKGTEDKNREVDQKDVKKAVDKLNKFLEGESTHVEYAVHDVYKHDVMIKIIDNDTGNVVMEVPPKKILDMVAKMCELVGVLIDKKA